MAETVHLVRTSPQLRSKRLAIDLTQRRYPLPDPRLYQRQKPVGRALGALGTYAPTGGSGRVSLPEYPLKGFPMGRWR